MRIRNLALAAAGAWALAASTVGAPIAAQAEPFVFANSTQYDNLDPHQSFDVGRVAIRLNMYDTLYRWLDNPPKLEPWIAKSHTISDDGLTYTFELRDDVTFHDGTPLTADDVVYSVERILGLATGAARLVGSMIEPGTTKAIDDHTVSFTLKKPAAIFLSVVPEIHIVNADLVKEHEEDGDWGSKWLASNEAGSGSYVLDQFDPAVGFSVDAYPDHFMGWDGEHLEEIEFRYVPDSSTIVLGLIRGDYHGADGYLPQEQIKRLEEAEGVKVLEEESMRLALINMNNQKPPFTDPHVRKAIAYAFDYDGMINGILGGSVTRNPVPIPNNLWGAPKDIEPYTFDLEKAKAEMAKASLKPDRVYEIVFSTGQVTLQQQAEILQAGLREIGIETELKVMPWASIQPLFTDPETSPDFFSTIVSTYYPDPHNWIGEMYSSDNWGVFKSAAYYKNPEVDALLKTGMTSTDPDERREAYAEAARLVQADSPGVFIYNTKWYGPYRDNVANVRFSPIGNGMEMRWVHLQ